MCGLMRTKNREQLLEFQENPPEMNLYQYMLIATGMVCGRLSYRISEACRHNHDDVLQAFCCILYYNHVK